MPPALCCFDGLFAQTAVVWQNRHRIAANWARLAVPSGFRVPAEVPPMDAVLCIRGTGAVAGSVHKGSGGGDGTFLFCQKGQQAADKGGVGALDTLEGPARKRWPEGAETTGRASPTSTGVNFLSSLPNFTVALRVSSVISKVEKPLSLTKVRT